MPKTVNSKSQVFHTNKVYQVILVLSKSDRRRLALFLDSPYFNKSKTLSTLGKTYIALAESGQTAGFDKVEIWHKLFANEPYDDVNFRKYNSDLMKMVERFLAQQSIESKSEELSIELLNEVVNKKIEPLYTSVVSGIKEKIATNPFQSSDFFYHNFKYESLFNKLNEKHKLYKDKVNYESISKNIDYYYFIEKIKLFCSTIAHQRMVNVKYEIDFEEEISKHLYRKDLSNFPALELYFLTYKVLKKEEDTKPFFDLKNALFTNSGKIPTNELVELTVSAMNFCTHKLNKGNTSFYNDYFELIQFGLVNKLFVNNNAFETWRFNNFVITAAKLGKFEWAENFIHEYKKYISDSERDNIVSFNMARLYYNQKKYHLVLSLLKNVEYKDLLLNINSKSILITTYYELSEYDALDYAIESFRVFLNRHKDISFVLRKSLLNFVKFTRRLIKTIAADSQSIQNLKNSIQKEKSNTANFEWLMEKIAELE